MGDPTGARETAIVGLGRRQISKGPHYTQVPYARQGRSEDFSFYLRGRTREVLSKEQDGE